MSRFVSGGTIDEPTERDAEWLKAQSELDAKKVEEAERARQTGGASLFETLQANKAAKQEKFEESIRLKNQFRNLDEDEVEFLDSVLESTRAQEAAVKQDMTEQLQLFRKQQEEAEKASKDAGLTEEAPVVAEVWSVGARKRKKGRNEPLGGVKLRRTSTAASEKQQDTPKKSVEAAPTDTVAALSSPPSQSKSTSTSSDTKPAPEEAGSETRTRVTVPTKAITPTNTLGLAAYSSDEDD